MATKFSILMDPDFEMDRKMSIGYHILVDAVKWSSVRIGDGISIKFWRVEKLGAGYFPQGATIWYRGAEVGVFGIDAKTGRVFQDFDWPRYSAFTQTGIERHIAGSVARIAREEMDRLERIRLQASALALGT